MKTLQPKKKKKKGRQVPTLTELTVQNRGQKTNRGTDIYTSANRKKYDVGNLSEFQHKTEGKGEGSHVKNRSKNIPEHPSNEGWINNT